MGLTDGTRLAAGGAHTCALAAGQVRWWGDNSHGQLGDGTTNNRNAPAAAIAGLTNVVDLAAGSYHTCARREIGEVYCWGFNFAGQLGDGTTTDRLVPTDVVWR